MKEILNKNIFILSLGQALSTTSVVIVATISPLIAKVIAPNQSLATLPIFIQFLTITLVTVPASYLMKKLHWKFGFIIGSLTGLTGIILSSWGLIMQNFLLFCIGAVGFGVMISFSRYFRFAAADFSTAKNSSRAISLVLAGGVMAAVLGPELAKWSRPLFTNLYLGSYIVVGCLILMLLINLFFLNNKATNLEINDYKLSVEPKEVSSSQKITLGVAIVSGMVSYGVMIFLMSATPLAMETSHHSFSSTAFVIQWHVLGMFAPSFFTGNLINRFGLIKIMLIGVVLLLLSVIFNLLGSQVVHYWSGLFVLGVGWNFVFIGATTMIAQLPIGSKKNSILALNEFLVSATTAICSLSSAAVLFKFNWQIVNYVTLPFSIFLLGSLLFLGYRNSKKNLVI